MSSSSSSSRPRRAGVNYGNHSAQSTPEKFARQILTQRRKTWIHEFQKKNQNDVGSPTWTEQLASFLKQKDSVISLEVIQKWVKNHTWITEPIDAGESESEEDTTAKNGDLEVEALETTVVEAEDETFYLSAIDIFDADVDAA